MSQRYQTNFIVDISLPRTVRDISARVRGQQLFIQQYEGKLVRHLSCHTRPGEMLCFQDGQSWAYDWVKEYRLFWTGFASTSGLGSVQLVVRPALSDEFIVRARLRDLPILNDVYSVSVHDGRQPVCDD